MNNGYFIEKSWPVATQMMKMRKISIDMSNILTLQQLYIEDTFDIDITANLRKSLKRISYLYMI